MAQFVLTWWEKRPRRETSVWPGDMSSTRWGQRKDSQKISIWVFNLEYRFLLTLFLQLNYSVFYIYSDFRFLPFPIWHERCFFFLNLVTFFVNDVLTDKYLTNFGCLWFEKTHWWWWWQHSEDNHYVCRTIKGLFRDQNRQNGICVSLKGVGNEKMGLVARGMRCN